MDSSGKSTLRIGYGAMGLAAFYGESQDSRGVQAIVDKALELGCKHFDTAEIYRTNLMGGDTGKETVWNEKQLGDALKGKPRDSFEIATKWNPMDHPEGMAAADVEAALDRSLGRLGMDYVDVYYMHRCVSLEKMQDWVKSAKLLKEKGKVKSIGLSEVPPAWLEKALEITHIDYVQMEWSALSRSIEDTLVPLCVKHGITVVAYSPLSRNLLADPVPPAKGDFRAISPRWSEENFKENQKIILKLKEAAEKLGASPAQLSLAWLYTKAAALGVEVMPIPGTTKVKNLETNVASLNFVPLDDATTAMIDSLKAKGERYTEGMMKSTFEGL